MVHQSIAHEALIAVLKANPRLICTLWERATKRRVPDGVARVRDVNLRSRSIEGDDRYLQVDILVTIHALQDPEGPALLAFVVEVQLNPNREKLYTWVEYLAAARREYRCAAKVLVFSPRKRVVGWARTLFEDEPELRPCLFGRDQIPLIRDERSARRQPALAVLSAVFRAETDRVAEHLELALLGLRALPAWQRGQYVALLEETIEGDIMDEILEKLAREAEADNEEALARSYGARKRRREAQAREEGRLSGLRDGLWLIVELRGLEVDDRQRALVEACASSEQLSRWLARLKTAERFADALRD